MNFLDKNLPTPCYILQEDKLVRNLNILKQVKDRTGCKIILALKAFSMYSIFPVINKYLDGATASSLNEARLAFEEFGKEVHVCAPAYSDEDFGEIIKYADHITFNSFSQWQKWQEVIKKCSRKIECAIRINPEASTAPAAIYDPCGPFSRLGVTSDNFENSLNNFDGITGLHFHTLCEQNADALETVLASVEEKFGDYLHKIKWLNFGGGHHITRPDYDLDLLCKLIIKIQEKYNVQVILEPGEAVALNTGFLVAKVLDIVQNNMNIAILDASAAAHMPDVLEMPYKPKIIGAAEPGELAFTYRLAGNTCLAGDIIGDYSFSENLEPGSMIVFCDMAHYTMVKNNTFNGLNLPAIAIYSEDRIKIVKSFGYDDFKSRL